MRVMNCVIIVLLAQVRCITINVASINCAKVCTNFLTQVSFPYFDKKNLSVPLSRKIKLHLPTCIST